MNTYVNSYAVAREAGVSRSVVSKVVNGTADKCRIAKATQKRVQRVITRMNYKPDRTLRNMFLKRSEAAHNPDPAQIEQILSPALEGTGYRLLIVPINEPEFKQSVNLVPPADAERMKDEGRIQEEIPRPEPGITPENKEINKQETAEIPTTPQEPVSEKDSGEAAPEQTAPTDIPQVEPAATVAEAPPEPTTPKPATEEETSGAAEAPPPPQAAAQEAPQESTTVDEHPIHPQELVRHSSEGTTPEAAVNPQATVPAAQSLKAVGWRALIWNAEAKLWQKKSFKEFTIKLHPNRLWIRNSYKFYKTSKVTTAKSLTGDFTVSMRVKGLTAINLMHRSGKPGIAQSAKGFPADKWISLTVKRKAGRLSIKSSDNVERTFSGKLKDTAKPLDLCIPLSRGAIIEIRKFNIAQS